MTPRLSSTNCQGVLIPYTVPVENVLLGSNEEKMFPPTLPETEREQERQASRTEMRDSEYSDNDFNS